ncbi:hypothetical protein Bca52824_048623 [Brassica carinata]|uniref:Uncharacterized protein n=1 Tax=Brassica carinata TaxID=52824 RepID=A0A8X7USD3_BRACI|nr:hypothetical protein Bca52824_048623 [Brassica carinata]
MHLSRSSLSLYLDHLSLETLSTKGDFVSFGVSHRRRLRRYLSSATSLSVALVGDLSLGGSPGGDRALSRWLFRNRKFVVCWFCLLVVLLLEAFPRWLKSKLSPQIESQQSSGSKRKRVGEEQSFQSSASMPSVNGEDEAMDRPIGVKAAKAKAKRLVGEEVKIPQGFKDMWEMRTKDLAFKDKLSNKKLLDSLIAKKEPLTELEMALKNKLITEMMSIISDQCYQSCISVISLCDQCSNAFLFCFVLQRKPIFCGLSARGMIPPPLPQEDTDDDVADVTPSEVEVVEISDEEEADMVELSSEDYMRNMGYLIRVEESEDDLEPEFRRLLQRMHEEEKKLREKKFKAMKLGIKLEEGQSSKVDGKKRKRRS